MGAGNFPRLTEESGPGLTLACSRHRGARFVFSRRNAVQLPGAAEARRSVPSSARVERRYAPAATTVVIGKTAVAFPIHSMAKEHALHNPKAERSEQQRQLVT